MKTIAGMIPVLFLVAGSAFGCPDFSGKYLEDGSADSFTVVQSGCDSWTWLAEGSAPSTAKLDGKTYTYQDDGTVAITQKTSWDGAKIVSVVEGIMKDIPPPKNVVMSITDEYDLKSNGDITLVETQVDNLFGNGNTTTTTHTFYRVQN